MVSPALNPSYSPTAAPNYAWNFASAGPSENKRFRSLPTEISLTTAAPPLYNSPPQYIMNPYQQVNPYASHHLNQPQPQPQEQPVPAPPTYIASTLPSNVPTGVIPGFQNTLPGLPQFTLQPSTSNQAQDLNQQSQQRHDFAQQYWAQNYPMPPPS